MFKTIRLKNFKAFDEITFDLTDGKTKNSLKNFIFLFGENGVGKSCLVESINFLSNTKNTLTFNNEFLAFVNRQNLDLEDSSHSFLKNFLQSHKLSHLIKSNSKIGSIGRMGVHYKGKTKNGFNYDYCLLFDDESVVEEKLLIDKKMFFHSLSNTNKKYYSSIVFNNKTLKEKIESMTSVYFGKHTILSCLCSFLTELNDESIQTQIDSKLIDFCDEIDNIRTLSSDFYGKSYINIEGRRIDIFEGNINVTQLNRLQQVEDTLNTIVGKEIENFFGFSYETEPLKEGDMYKYKLFFKRDSTNGIINIPYIYESEGIREFLEIAVNIYNSEKEGGILVLDEANDKISYRNFKKLLKRIVSLTNSQIIMTSHVLLLINDIKPKYLYMLIGGGKVKHSLVCLKEFRRAIQKNTNVLNKYLKDDFPKIDEASND